MTTTPTAPDPLHTGPHVDTAIATLRSELARSDGKASLLLALTGAALAALVSMVSGRHLPAAALAVGVLGAVALLAATVILLAAVRPYLNGAGWPSWPTLQAEQLREQLAAGQHLEEVRVLAAAAKTKFLRIRYAVDCVLAGLGLLTVAAVLAAAL